MKKTLAILGVAALTMVSANAQLLITGIIDGPRTDGTPKAIEIFVTENVADLSLWNVQNFNNGGTTPTTTFALSGSATAGSYLYVASESPNFTAYFGFSPTFTSGALNVNGDDVVALRLDTTIVDIFGIIGTQPAVDTSFNFLDTWWYRSNLTTATPNWTASDWFFAPGQSDALDTLGATGVNPAAPDPLHMPVGTFVAVPEPSTWVLIGLGFGFVLWSVRRGRRSVA